MDTDSEDRRTNKEIKLTLCQTLWVQYKSWAIQKKPWKDGYYIILNILFIGKLNWSSNSETCLSSYS